MSKSNKILFLIFVVAVILVALVFFTKTVGLITVDIVNEKTINYAPQVICSTIHRCEFYSSFSPRTNCAVLIPSGQQQLYQQFLDFGITEDSSLVFTEGKFNSAPIITEYKGSAIPIEGKGLVRGRDAIDFYVIALGHPGAGSSDQQCSANWNINFASTPDCRVNGCPQGQACYLSADKYVCDEVRLGAVLSINDNTDSDVKVKINRGQLVTVKLRFVFDDVPFNVDEFINGQRSRSFTTSSVEYIEQKVFPGLAGSELKIKYEYTGTRNIKSTTQELTILILQSTPTCNQVITRACNPVTKEIRDFPTPCDVPSSWTTDLTQCNLQCNTVPYCTDWSICSNDIQQRRCFNECNIERIETRSCSIASCGDGICQAGEVCAADCPVTVKWLLLESGCVSIPGDSQPSGSLKVFNTESECLREFEKIKENNNFVIMLFGIIAFILIIVVTTVVLAIRK